MYSTAAVMGMVPGIQDVSFLTGGGQKHVYRAIHERYGLVAIKFFHTGGDDRINREIEVSTQCNLPNVPKLHNWQKIIDTDGNEVVYLIEEFIEGETLDSLLRREGRISLRQGISLLQTLLEIETKLEECGLIHRDIKPQNIIVKPNGSYYLLDFGIARHMNRPSLTATDSPFGPHTPGYAAPEQFRNYKRELDVRADLFAIGVVVYEALSGENPFTTNVSHHLDILVRTETIIPSLIVIEGDTQRMLIGLLSTMMKKLPSQRPPNAQTALDWFRSMLPTLEYGG